MRLSRSEQHARQVENLETVLQYTLRPQEREAFQGMLTYLEPPDQDGSNRLLSDKQRDWLNHVLEKHQPTYLNEFSAGKVPIGNPNVVVNVGPKVLKPPGRRTG
jgi:hypothetical protein